MTLFVFFLRVETTNYRIQSRHGSSLNPNRLKANCHICGRCFSIYPSFIGSMGQVYLPTFTIKNQPNVAKYTIHGLDPMGPGILRL